MCATLESVRDAIGKDVSQRNLLRLTEGGLYHADREPNKGYKT
jgi:hypothetical protein